ncbi:GSCOCG00001204001-RA-CDS [Cotesia congregata]|uniref:Chromatin accessibility complex protein 1 n=1 Tax=Cotesia congregata TaxID=51543 RepID=A0A8J2HFA6_COTCN|nr:GSCOCG00001204001-RA-CDS [Cotesia congregata]CAG5097451.1 Similar to Chrac1: Chromatin accessibility complex protein 1 (Mus musculus) [Cotesia congregata]
MAANQTPQKIRELRLPLARVRTIMKSSPDVESIGQDGLFLVTKATEMFIHYLATEAYTKANQKNALDYKHLADVAQTNETLEFLKEIMPRKITVRQFKELMAAKEATAQSSSSGSSDSDSDSQSDSESGSDSDSKKDDDEDDDNEEDDDDDHSSEDNKSISNGKNNSKMSGSSSESEHDD